MSRRIAGRGVLATCFLIAGACEGARSLPPLQQSLANRLGTNQIAITLSGATLGIDLPASIGARDSQLEIASEVGAFIRDHYQGYGSLQTIEVSFDSVSAMGSFGVKRNRVVYRLHTSDLGKPEKPPTDPATSVKRDRD
jgi:hypothetical protein